MFTTEEDTVKIATLDRRLTDFYSRTSTYPVYEKMTWHPTLWTFVLQQMKKTRQETGRILEIGAAKSGFGEYLKSKNENYKIVFHDINDRCRTHLEKYSDELYFCPFEEIGGEKYDIVFHSYVFEHVTRPKQFLDSVDKLLTESGRHIIECPRYDLPLYIPPAIRHMEKKHKILYIAKSFFRCYPDYAIVKNPAIFHRPFRSDYDAVHRVTLRSLKRSANETNTPIEVFRLKRNRVIQDVMERIMRARVVLHRRGSETGYRKT